MEEENKKTYQDQSGLDKEITAPITLKISKGMWELFKDSVPRKITLNDQIVQLIINFCMEESEPCTQKEIETFMREQKEYADAKKSKK